MQILDRGAPEAGRVRADVSFVITSVWLLSFIELPNREECNLVIDQYGVNNFDKIVLRQEDAELLRP